MLVPEDDLPGSGGGGGAVVPEDDLPGASKSVKRVKPGDVAARRAQVEAQARAEGPNKVREDTDFFKSLGEGLSTAAGGIGRTIAALVPGSGTSLKDAFVPEEFSLKGLLNLAPVQAAAGAAQVVASPLEGFGGVGLSNIVARGAEKVADITGSDTLGALTQAAGDVLGPAGIGKLAKSAKPIAQGSDLLQPNRTKALRAAARGQDDIIAAEQRAAQAVTSAQRAQEAKLAANEAATASKVEKLRSELSGAQPARESIESIGEAAKRNLPGRQDLEAIGGKQLSEATGEAFKKHYEEVRAARKATADELYDNALGPRLPSQKSVADVIDDASEMEEVLKSRKLTPDEFQQLLDTGTLGKAADATDNIRDLHDSLIHVNFAKRAAGKAQNDNIARELGIRADEIRDKMEKLQPGVLKQLADADSFYGKEFAPYFSKGSITRAIADKDTSAIAKSAILPRTSSGKEVATIERTLELIGDNKPLQREVAHSHLNGLIDEASRAKDFREAFTKGWDRYTNPSGNNNKVLRMAYGDEYERVNSLVNQFKSSKPKDFDAVVESMVSSVNKGEAAAQRGIKEALSENIRVTKEAGKEASGQISFANKARDVEIKALKARIAEDVRKFVGDKATVKDGRLVPTQNYTGGKFIGQLYVVEGVMDAVLKGPSSGLMKITMGAGIITSRALINRLATSEKGIGLLKAAARNAPGTAAAAANARRIENFLKGAESSQELKDQRSNFSAPSPAEQTEEGNDEPG